MIDIRKLLANEETRKLEVLTTPVGRLGLELRTSLLRQPIERHMALIKRRGIRLKPYFYLGEDWGCVAGTANIEIGFYDADLLLKELNAEIRGWTNDARTVDYLLRHETGHAFCYAHRLYKNKAFRKAFGVKGSFFETYPETDRFKPHPWSRDFVNPNRDHYAQKHPDEDFAETFGVWLTPPANWKKAYRNRAKALSKLHLIGELVALYGKKPPEVPPDPRNVDAPVRSIDATAAEVLGASLAPYRKKATGYVDPLLRKIGQYCPRPSDPGLILLADVIGAHRGFIIRSLARNTRVTVTQASYLVAKLLTRARALRLYIPLSKLDPKLIDVVCLASALATRYSVNRKLT
ncbi:MAG: putative zinc-binding metallopeptidase [Candidatus Aminicenantes bacterium]